MIDISLDNTFCLDIDLPFGDTFDIDFEEEYSLDVTLYVASDELFIDASASREVDIDIDIGTVINRGEYPLYEGPYVAVPLIREQIFETDNKAMNSDFKVKEITYLEVPNASGGLTVTIGEM